MIKLVVSSEFARSSAPRLTPLRHAMLASASPATTTYSEAVAAVVVVDVAIAGRAAGAVAFNRAPTGITSVWPGWITLVNWSELARRSSDNRTPWRHARPARLSPSRTVTVVSAVVLVSAVAAPEGAAAATPSKSGRATESATPVARMIRAVRFMPGPSARDRSTLIIS